jgi:tRNA A37 threonylcarbamoyladenosine synthetase subunit TsaC/SUA5/YrdC
MLQALYALKKRPSSKYCSLMVKDWDMLCEFAEVPPELPIYFFSVKPRTVILKPTTKLPLSEFWPKGGVAFRVAPLKAVAAAIEYPVSATSANLSGQEPIFDPEEIKKQWGGSVSLFSFAPLLDGSVVPSEIWDYTTATAPVRIR